MSDNKKWFKVWATILLDPVFNNLAIADVGRWCKLGALMVSQGENGMLTLYPPAKAFVVALECESFEDTLCALKRLPNVRIEEGQSEHGKTIVIMRNWYKYQVDTTHTERQRRARHKRRGEEKRSTPTSTSTPSATLAGGLTPPRATRENGGKPEREKTAADLPESERLTPEEMKAIRLKMLGRKP